METETGDVIVAVAMAAVGVVGFLLAARAVDNEFYLFGLSLAGFSYLFVFGCVRRHFDRQDAARVRNRPHG
jgi:hypothetical protein